MEVIIKGKVPLDPRERVLAIEAAMQAICQNAGEDPADGVMALLTAAVHISMKQSKLPPGEMARVLANCLGHAIIAADDFFKLRVAG